MVYPKGPVHPLLRKVGPNMFPAGHSLWISDFANNAVYVYTWPLPSPSATPVATVTGLNSPQGECVGPGGVVFVTNSGGGSILVYSHNGTAMPTISDTGAQPTGCAYDSGHGKLAVSNDAGGSIALYSGPCCNYSSPTTITDPSFGQTYFLGFKPNSDLFVDGKNSSGNVSYWKLPYPAYTVTQIGFTPSNLIGFPGGVQWDGHYMTVGDQLAGTVNRVNALGHLVAGGTTTLTGASSCDVVQDFIGAGAVPVGNPHRITGPEAACGVPVVFPYFVGLAPVQATGSSSTQPEGAAVSP